MGDIEIARSIKMENITKVAEKFGIEEEYIYNPDTEMFEKNRVDTCGLTRSTLKLFEGCATYLPANTDASKGDILSSQDYLDMKDFLYYLDRDEVKVVKSDPEYDVRFKVVEWYEKIREHFRRE